MNGEIESAKAQLEQWLSHPNELGRKPAKIEYTNSFKDEDEIKCLIFKYKKTILSKWLLGIVSESGVFSEMLKYNENTEIADAKKLLKILKNYWKQQAKEIEKQNNNRLLQHCNTAVEYAKSFQKDFDYSKNSIKDLEEILDYYSNDISKSKPTDEEIWCMSVIFGSYLGQTMLKNAFYKKGYYWGTDNSNNVPMLINDNKNSIAPVDKVYKRLINGNKENIVSFYDLIMKNEAK